MKYAIKGQIKEAQNEIERIANNCMDQMDDMEMDKCISLQASLSNELKSSKSNAEDRSDELEERLNKLKKNKF